MVVNTHTRCKQKSAKGRSNREHWLAPTEKWEVGAKHWRDSSPGGMCWGPEQVCDSHMLPAISLKERVQSNDKSKRNATQSAFIEDWMKCVSNGEDLNFLRDEEMLSFQQLGFNTPTYQWNTEPKGKFYLYLNTNGFSQKLSKFLPKRQHRPI